MFFFIYKKKIRKASQSALIRLFELEQIKNDEIEEHIIPLLCQLDRACDDFKNESILVCFILFKFIFILLLKKKRKIFYERHG